MEVRETQMQWQDLPLRQRIAAYKSGSKQTCRCISPV